MKKHLLLVALLATVHLLFAQDRLLTILPSGGNKKASVSEQIGLTWVTVHYDRPGVKGREGKIWGDLVHTGFVDQGFGSSKAAPWRAGANENTTIEFSNDVLIEGQPLKAGKYGFFIAYDPVSPMLIFSKNSNSWGSYYYNEQEDVLRVKTKTATTDKSTEWLEYRFTNQQANSATLELNWEKLSIPIKIEVNYIKDQLASFRNELRTDKGFTWQSWNQAAKWCVQQNTNLEEALLWSDSATGPSFGGAQVFSTWMTRSQLLDKMGKQEEATVAAKKAISFGDMTDLHQYGRALLQQKKNKEALDIFKLNASKYPNEFTTLMGLTRGYSANGDFKKALQNANKALPLAPNDLNKQSVMKMIEQLKKGKDVN